MEMKPNFAKAYSAANEILVKSNIIASFPFSPIDLVKEQALCVCRSYSLARKYGVDMKDFGSESAVIMSMGGKTIIFYDDLKPKAHKSVGIMIVQFDSEFASAHRKEVEA